MNQHPAHSYEPRRVILASHREASAHVAELFASTIEQSPQTVLGLATGSTPIECYNDLIRRHEQGSLSFASVTTFNLDEYVGLAGDHPQSFRHFMQTHLFDHVDIDPARAHVPNGVAEDLNKHANEYDLAIRKAGGIDLQLLGIGHNGHIAFNEPGASADSQTRVVNLSLTTLESNSRFFNSPEKVPRRAITMGIGTILKSAKIVLLAFGEDKAKAVAGALEGPVGPQNPASWLRTHVDTTFVLDAAAASQLSDGTGI